MTKVAILGGGVGGLSAAHELIERGFDVEVYEAGAMWGGKARSIMWDQADKDKKSENDENIKDIKKPVPSEHGFRFFPAFYRHLPDTMRRIPIKGKTKKVVDNLVGATEVGILRKDAKKIVLPGRYPVSMDEWEKAFYDLLHAQFHISDEEMKFFVEKLLVILTSCQERRLAEYEKIDWWTFIEADLHSEEYQKVFGLGLTRSLVAMKAELASTRTVGNILLQLVLYMFVLDVNNDRLLNAPTNDAWIDPWIEYLAGRVGKDGKPIVDAEGKPVPGKNNLHLYSPTVRLECDGKSITRAIVKQNDKEVPVIADYYICAFPVEVMTRLLKDPVHAPILEAAPVLASVKSLNTDWMNGAQFYLAREIPVVKGHVIYLDSHWALTSISQKQFWGEIDLARYGDGKIKDILSVDISSWTTPGTETTNKPAKQCSKEEIKKEVWAQLKAHLNKEGQIVLDDNDLLDWYLDPNISFPLNQEDKEIKNAEPLLVNTIDSWKNRPEAACGIANMLLASDYVRTNTDLATMEGANEAARRAVNVILEKEQSMYPRCSIWPLEEPAMFGPLRDYDLLRFKQGLPHARRSWMTLSLAGGYHFVPRIAEAIALPILKVGLKIGAAIARPIAKFGLPVIRVGQKMGESIAAPIVSAGGAGSRLTHIMASLLRVFERKPPQS